MQRVDPGESVKLPINLFSDSLLSGFTVPLRLLTDHPEWITLDSVELDTAIPDMQVLTDPGEPLTFIVRTPVQEPPLPESTKVTVYAHLSAASDALRDTVMVDTTTLTYGSEDYTYEFIDEFGVASTPAFREGAIIILGPNGTESIDAYCYPNPLNPDIEGTNLCYDLATNGSVTVKIYDSGGNLVLTVIENEDREARDTICEEWNGKNGQGKPVANGVYFFVVESSDGERMVGKIAVLR